MNPTSSSSPTDDVVLADAQHPWLGLWSYTEEQRDWFRGRAKETEDLLTLVRREPLTVLFGVSGLGKTSLVKAGLFPRLRERDAFPVWEMDGLPVYVRLDHGSIRSAGDQILDRINQEALATGADVPKPLDGESLWEYFHRRALDGTGFEVWSAGNRPLVPVLVLDQFEELFTLGFSRPGADGGAVRRREGLHAFVTDLACLVENRPPDSFRQRLEAEPDLAARYSFDPSPVRIVLSLREDFVADLEGLRPLIRLVATSRLRLLPLSGEQARKVIQQNGADLIEPTMADPLVRFVAARQRARETMGGDGDETDDAAPMPLAELRVDPALLSVMLRELNHRRLASSHALITEDLLHASEQDILEQFYDRSFAGMDEGVRRFVENELLTATGWRDSSAIDDALSQPGITQGILDILVNRRLLRYEDRLGHRRVELAHDVLAPLVRDLRDARIQREEAEAAREREREAEEKLVASQKEISRTEFLFARLLLELKDNARANARLARALKSYPKNQAASTLAMNLVTRRMNRGSLRLIRHEASVGSAMFSPDGLAVLTYAGNAAFLWDANSREMLRAPFKHDGRIRSATFNPDGSRILTAAWDCSARLWDTNTGQSHATHLQHDHAVIAAVFSPDGSRILTGSDDGTARLWDTATGEPLAVMFSHKRSITSAVFSPDGTRVLTASLDNTAQLWDATTGQPLCKSVRHGREINSARFSPDGARILTASGDRTARIWDAATGQPIAEPISHNGGVSSAIFSPDGSRIVTSSHDRTARVWDATSTQALASPLKHKGAVVSACFSPDGTQVLTASNDHTARLWSAASGERIADPFYHKDWVHSAAFSPDGARILTASKDNNAQLWDSISCRPLAQPLRHKSSIRSAAFSQDGTRILTASAAGTVRFWDGTSCVSLASYSVGDNWAKSSNEQPDSEQGSPPARHKGSIVSARMSPDSRWLLTTSDDRTARLWDATSGNPISIPLCHASYVNSAVFSPDGNRVLTASSDNTARLWDAASGESLMEPMRHEGYVLSADFSPDGKQILTASEDRTARLWDAISGQPLIDPICHEEAIHSAVFSPDGRCILTASSDKTARLWDAATGHPLGEPLRHTATVRWASFSPDGTKILTASDDTTARLWDTASGEPLDEPMTHGGYVSSAVFSPDGSQILTASEDHSARLWDGGISELTDAEILRLSILLEISTGWRLNDRGMLEAVPTVEIERLGCQISADGSVDRWLSWWWSDPFTRSINASSQISVPTFVRSRIREVLEWPNRGVKACALQEARDAFPNHPLVLICLANQGTHGDPSWLAHYATSRLLGASHYVVPMPPPGKQPEIVGRQHETAIGLAEDCFLAARLLRRHGRKSLAIQVLNRALSLAPENVEYRMLSRELAE